MAVTTERPGVTTEALPPENVLAESSATAAINATPRFAKSIERHALAHK